jgi:uncharacterized protein (TIGR01319 family)
MLLIDIGSTYTKLAVLDEHSKRLIAAACSPTTIHDVSIGFNAALSEIKEQPVPEYALADRYACSSAAGGLRMVAVGLVPELTMEAAKRAALGAGAKVVATYSFSLMSRQVREIEAIRPDILLLAGGTDGGDKKTVIHNAERIALSKLDVPVVFAGNREAADEITAIFDRAHKEVRITDNVMPTVSKINVDSVREVIREVFLRRIIVAKGLDKINQFINAIVYPTPLAVLEAAKILARAANKGVVVIDVGGATTDVHSVAEGVPHDPQIVLKGLPEPFAKRTVEGDIGVRHNISTIVETVGRERFLKTSSLTDTLDLAGLDGLVTEWAKAPSSLPQGSVEEKFDRGLAASAVEIAMNRHVGYLEEMWTPMGKILVQYGKDLTQVDIVIGTGGPIVHSTKPQEILERALYQARDPLVLKPQNPKFHVDKNYILFAIGLISRVCSSACEEIALNYLQQMRLT